MVRRPPISTRTAPRFPYPPLVRSALAYNFQGTPGDVRPFSKLFNGKALSFLRDFNFTPLPSVVDFRIDVDRYYSENTIRAAEPGSWFKTPTTYFKNFQITRLYGLRWDLASSLQLDYKIGRAHV